MKRLVTLCTFDQTAEANPAWHGAFFLSKENEKTQQVEVTDTWGFYGMPTTGNPNHWFTQLKRSVGLDLDFLGNHGWLKHEEFRFMDLGHGLHGYSYEVTEDQFKKLQTECLKRVKDQNDAVKEALGNDVLKTMELSTEKFRNYPGEQYSKEIYTIEKAKAIIEQREPRLKSFDFNLTLGKWFRPTLKESHTCKTEALNLLETILPPEKLNPFRARTFPRFVSGSMEDVLLHSEGPLDVHTNSDGRKMYFRNRGTEGVKLVWSIPPQKIEELPDSGTKAFFAVDEEYLNEAKAIVSKLQGLEWLFRNAMVDDRYKDYQTKLADRIVACYQAFSIIKPEAKKPKISGWIGSALSLFGTPKNSEQADLKMQIERAKDLFNSLYMAIVDEWEIDNSLPPEPALFPESEAPQPEGMEDTSLLLENPLEALAFYLPVEDQKKLCKIIGRNYCESDHLTLSAS